MKHFLVMSCLLVAAYGLSQEALDQFKEKLQGTVDACRGEISLGGDDINSLKSHQVPASQPGKCFIACVHKKFGVQDKAGKIDKEGVYALLEKLKPIDEEYFGKLKMVADTCLGQVTDAADECETAANIMICVHKEKENHGLEPLDLNWE